MSVSWTLTLTPPGALMHALQLAATLAHSRNQAAEASTWDGKVAKKQEELLETPMLEEAKARTKLDKHLSKVLLD